MGNFLSQAVLAFLALPTLVAFAVVSVALPRAQAPARTLDIYMVNVEGGEAMLFVASRSQTAAPG